MDGFTKPWKPESNSDALTIPRDVLVFLGKDREAESSPNIQVHSSRCNASSVLFAQTSETKFDM